MGKGLLQTSARDISFGGLLAALSSIDLALAFQRSGKLLVSSLSEALKRIDVYSFLPHRLINGVRLCVLKLTC